MQIHVIFQVRGEDRWLDYCREEYGPTLTNETIRSELNVANDWARGQCTSLERQHGKAFRFVVEVW